MNVPTCGLRISICILVGLQKRRKILSHFHMHILLTTSGIRGHVMAIGQESSIDLQSNQIKSD